nr:interferon-induced protein 44-like [Lytechinus pictus]
MLPSQYIIIFSVLGLFILIAFIAIITVLCRGATTRTIKELRKSIRDYTFKIPDSDDKATAKIGLYGEMGAGKSTFINSIEFAYNGQRSQPTGARGDTAGGHSMIRSCLPLTEYISLFDNRGMRDFSLSYVDKYMKEISDEKEAGTQTRLLDEEIHCVVFLYRHR